MVVIAMSMVLTALPVTILVLVLESIWAIGIIPNCTRLGVAVVAMSMILTAHPVTILVLVLESIWAIGIIPNCTRLGVVMAVTRLETGRFFRQLVVGWRRRWAVHRVRGWKYYYHCQEDHDQPHPDDQLLGSVCAH